MKFLTTDEISGEIVKVIRSAKGYIVLASPYVKIRENYIDRIREASNRNVEIHFVFGKSDLDEREVRKLETIPNLNLHYLENLHAKCYLNESTAIITSMNLHEYSEKNNREMGMMIEREYNEKLYNEINDELKSIVDASTHYTLKQPKYQNNYDDDVGYCIRCSTQIDFDPDRPLCNRCFNEWRQYGDVYYSEQFCHACGDRERTSYAKPLCYSCFREIG
ncbi:MAG: phospholipase D-like domain-containing protein [Spirochaetales bacterium]|uniref:Phospholipase D-like domain-containing protein n=1 Tax=Candidatus Thalassospirochaeta sargassi TaxID=3119039 RepID=A0AAJ1MJI2_9SPIO|nr:phospholipase D-like domain-containing protein [Spirochaetales bacterium]